MHHLEFHRLGLEAGAVAFLGKKDLDTGVLRQVIDDVIAWKVGHLFFCAACLQ
jgi:hypothetical protein